MATLLLLLSSPVAGLGVPVEKPSSHAHSIGAAVKVPPSAERRPERESLVVQEHTEAVERAFELDNSSDAEHWDDDSSTVLLADQCEGAPDAADDFSDVREMSDAQQFSSIRPSLTEPWRKQSELAECQATVGPRDDPHFLEKVRPCGNLSTLCYDLPLVEANLDYPGGGLGNVIPGQDYIVQFDVGLHPGVAKALLGKRLKGIDSCVSCPTFEEKCLEVVVTGGASWGNLGMAIVGKKAYDCMGGCGGGCLTPGTFGRRHKDVGGLDCLKHDVCSAWKSVLQGRPAKGFCNDPDCGDEAAMTIFNCWRGWRFFGAFGSGGRGPLSEPAICEQEPGVRGCWSHSGWLTEGRCKIFQGWARGQGIPDPHPLRSPIQRL